MKCTWIMSAAVIACQCLFAQIPAEFLDLSLDDLLNLEVTSVSKKPESLFQAPAAIFVITNEDILRSGARNLPETLRLVPGMQVFRIDSHRWAISVRGDSGQVYQNKLLVLIDGRSIFTPTFNGVYWDLQDYIMEDIDRIEVIRGPGGTLWGANAVNGVINIVTKSAEDTQGGLVSIGGGNVQSDGSVRYGWKSGENSWTRIYGKYNYGSNLEYSNGEPADDRRRLNQVGFKTDINISQSEKLTLQADAISNFLEQGDPKTARKKAYNLMARLDKSLVDGSNLTLKGFVDRYHLDQSNGYRTIVKTFDFEAQYGFSPAENHEMTIGGGSRYINMRSDPTTEGGINLGNISDLSIQSAFVQDKITLKEDKLYLTLGTKVEYNSMSHWEFQPNVRMTWTPHEKHTVWAALSRAIRTPSIYEHQTRSIIYSGPHPFIAGNNLKIALNGSQDLDAENLTAYELGYRVSPASGITIDATLFYNKYTDLSIYRNSNNPDITFQPPSTSIWVLPIYNNGEASLYGGECAVTWQASQDLRLTGSYAFSRMDLEVDPANDTPYSADEDEIPTHVITLRSSWDVSKNVKWDVTAQYYDKRPVNTKENSYVLLGTTVSWRPTERLEFWITGNNLLEPNVSELSTLSTGGANNSEVPRSFYAGFRFSF